MERTEQKDSRRGTETFKMRVRKDFCYGPTERERTGKGQISTFWILASKTLFMVLPPPPTSLSIASLFYGHLEIDLGFKVSHEEGLGRKGGPGRETPDT